SRSKRLIVSSASRGNVSHGDGVYKSTDGGKTWMHLGLEDTRHIGKVRIHPQNPDLVYVAALGHAHGPNNQRGVYRSHDGGKTWEQILFASEDVGAHDLAIDPNNPRILYAALWRARRMPHTTYPPKGWPARDARYRFQWTFPILLSPHDPHVLYSAGNHVFRSTDEGNSWEEFSPDLTRNDKSTMEPSG